tara:strand:- start:245 stop:571 length:327 start_codon:yes stop_codon:yes gene_type:complete
MELLTDAIKKALPPLETTSAVAYEDKGKPTVRFFNPMGSQSWEIFEGSPEGDDWRLFGMCDLGFGSPELGYVMLSELQAIKLPFGMGIERDIAVGPSENHPEWAAMEA